MCANILFPTVVIRYCGMNQIKSNGTFCCIFQYRSVQRGTQHGGREYDDFQNCLNMTSHENPLSEPHPRIKMAQVLGSPVYISVVQIYGSAHSHRRIRKLEGRHYACSVLGQQKLEKL